jgi:ReqiPepy6 Gp37-like protein
VSYVLRVRRHDLDAVREVAEVDPWMSLEAVLRFNDVETWVLRLPLAAQGVAELLLDGYGLVLKRSDGSVVFSGPVTKRRQLDDESGSTLEISGVGDNVWLARRLAHPQPGSSAPPYSTDAYDVRTDVCSTVLLEYVDWNLGFASINSRTVGALDLAADPVIGATVTGRARWQLLLTMLQELAIAGGDLGFRIRQSGSLLVFSVYQPIDRSASVIFDRELGNLRAAEWTEEAPDANFIYCGGSGDGTARTIREGQDSDSIAQWGRVERFRDRRDTTDTGELDQSIADELSQGAGVASLAITPIDLPQMAYGVHYDLGDRVTAVIRGQIVSEIVREVKLVITPSEGAVVTPTIGTPGRQKLLGLISRIRRSERRLANLERS